MKKVKIDKLNIQVFSDRNSMGNAAAQLIGEELKKMIAKQGTVRMIFAAAPSQNEVLETLKTVPGIDWPKVTAFHMDEYIGLGKNAPQRFATYLNEHIFDHLPFGKIHFLEGDSPEQMCHQYSGLLKQKQIDIVCLGIGENGHIAFNDPPVADFHDPNLVKIVELDLACRQQQVNDGCFPDLDSVPKKAVTLTIPALMSGKLLVCSVPGKRKQEAVRRTVYDKITTECPASILRTHDNCHLFVDEFSWGTS